MQGPEQISDRELIESLAQGQSQALEALFRRHSQAVYSVARSMVGLDAAEDVLQETFTSAWEHAASHRGGNVRGWLLGIARNHCRRQWRKQDKAPSEGVSLNAIGERAGWGQAMDWHSHLENRDSVDKAWPQLRPAEREALALVDVAGMSASEAADQLEITVPALKSRLHRGRLAFMAALRNGGVG